MPGFWVEQAGDGARDPTDFRCGVDPAPTGIERALSDAQPYALPAAVSLLGVAILSLAFARRDALRDRMLGLVPRIAMAVLITGLAAAVLRPDVSTWPVIPGVGYALLVAVSFGALTWLEGLLTRRAE